MLNIIFPWCVVVDYCYICSCLVILLAQTLDYYHHLAEKEHDLTSALTLANIYLYGYRDVEIDIPKAVKFLTLASEGDVVSAQVRALINTVSSCVGRDAMCWLLSAKQMHALVQKC